MRETRLAQVRPYLYNQVEVDVSDVTFTVRNGGPTPAVNVQIEWWNPLDSSGAKGSVRFPFLGPRSTISKHLPNLLRLSTEEAEALRRGVSVILSFRNSYKDPLTNQSFSEQYQVDVGLPNKGWTIAEEATNGRPQSASEIAAGLPAGQARRRRSKGATRNQGR